MTDLKVWVDLASFLMSLGAMVFAWVVTRRKDVDELFKKGSDRMDALERRIQSLEQTVAVLPSKEDIHKIELSLANMNGSLGRMEAVLEGNQQIMTRLETIVSRHENHLLNGSKG